MYEPYCANYTMASEIMLQEEHNLTVRLLLLAVLLDTVVLLVPS